MSVSITQRMRELDLRVITKGQPTARQRVPVLRRGLAALAELWRRLCGRWCRSGRAA